jgi:magnesium-transporting ATPase (P-type)
MCLVSKEKKLNAKKIENNIASSPWAHEFEVVYHKQDVNPDKGLSNQEIKEPRRPSGRNRLRTKSSKSAWKLLVEQFKNIIIWLLIASAGVSFVFGEWVDGIAVDETTLVSDCRIQQHDYGLGLRGLWIGFVMVRSGCLKNYQSWIERVVFGFRYESGPLGCWTDI